MPDQDNNVGLEEREEVFDDDTTLLDDLIDKKAQEKKPETDINLVEEEEPEIKPEEEKEEKEELVDTNSRAVDLKRIKDKYPEFAKTREFQELRNAYHREAQYTELFPTLDDAREAAENNETFEKLNDALVNRGDVSVLLDAVKEADPASVKRIATGFLDAVAKIDGALYVEAISPVIRRLAKNINEQGQKYLKRNKESEDGLALVATARNIMQFAFDDADAVEKDEPQVDPKITEREQELLQRENAIRLDKYNSAYSTVLNSATRHIENAIAEGLDPNNTLNEFTRDTLVEKIRKEVESQVSNDQVHIRRMNSLWKRAEAEGYNRESLSRLISAYLERARPIIPSVRNKFRSIALKGRASSQQEVEEEKPLRIANKGRSGRAPDNDGKVRVRSVDSKKIDYRNTTDDDIFDGKIKLKG